MTLFNNVTYVARLLMESYVPDIRDDLCGLPPIALWLWGAEKKAVLVASNSGQEGQGLTKQSCSVCRGSATGGHGEKSIRGNVVPTSVSQGLYSIQAVFHMHFLS